MIRSWGLTPPRKRFCSTTGRARCRRVLPLHAADGCSGGHKASRAPDRRTWRPGIGGLPGNLCSTSRRLPGHSPPCSTRRCSMVARFFRPHWPRAGAGPKGAGIASHCACVRFRIADVASMLPMGRRPGAATGSTVPQGTPEGPGWDWIRGRPWEGLEDRV